MRYPALLLLLCSTPALAQQSGQAEPEPPAFDRPGLGFSTGVLPRGGVALELGLPRYERDRDADGVRSTQYSADLNLRVGLSERVELQAFSAPYNHLRLKPRGAPSSSSTGAGDVGVAVKLALPTGSERQGFALLASTTFATGSSDFSEAATQYALGGSYEYQFDDRWTGALYANATRGGEDAFSWSPSLSLAINERLGVFVEAGFEHVQGEASTAIAGAGMTWMATPRMQLDASFDLGLDQRSPDLQAGVGASFYFD